MDPLDSSYYPLDEKLTLGRSQVRHSKIVPMWGDPALVARCTVFAVHGEPRGSLSVFVQVCRDWHDWTTLPMDAPPRWVTATAPGLYALHHDTPGGPGLFVRLRYETDASTARVTFSTGIQRRRAPP